MEALRLLRSLNRDQRNTFIACFLGWALDAFDFFLLTFVLVPVGRDFGKTVPQVAFAITLTLMMRPIGAFIFGMLGDRFGRRIPLMIDIIFYSVIELLSAFAPNFTVFLILRALFGIGMGGEWGLGASLAMESLPKEARGLFSGILQQGYAFGYLLAALTFWLVFPTFGWRGLFIAGAVPALLVIFIRARVPESPAWERQRKDITADRFRLGPFIRQHGLLFLYSALMMTAFNYMSHGTQDLYPTFLKQQLHFDTKTTGLLTVALNLGAIVGGLFFGAWSEKVGRRRAIITAALLAIPMVPLWTYGGSVVLLGVGVFLLQIAVQGAWGVVPVHLNELSPDAVRGTLPGFAYQGGNLLASVTAPLLTHFAVLRNNDYAFVMSIFIACVAVFLAIVTALGPEARGAPFGARAASGS